MTISLETVVIKYLRANRYRGARKRSVGLRSPNGWLGANVPVSQKSNELIFVSSSIGFMHEQLTTEVRIREEPPTKLGKIFVQSCLGLGSRISLTGCRVSRSPSISAMSPVGTTLTKPDLNALYFATYRMERPRGWKHPFSVGHYWRAALVVFFNYGVDTGTVFKSANFHEPLLWRHVSWQPEPPNGQGKDSRYGWIYYRRVKTGKKFHRPMNRVVHAHLKSLKHDAIDPDGPVFDAGSSRPNQQFQALCKLAGVKPKQDVETGNEKPWVLKDLRKTCATYYDEHMPESSIETLGHSVGGVTYRHYAHRAPLAFKAILSLPQPTAFNALVHGYVGECPCCRRKFPQA